MILPRGILDRGKGESSPPAGWPCVLFAPRDAAQQDNAQQDNTAQEDRAQAIVLKCNEQSMRVRISGEDATITLRTSGYDAMRIVPGQLIEATLAKRWTWRGDAYATGSIGRAWTDVPLASGEKRCDFFE